jgi:Putative lumazine-binding
MNMTRLPVSHVAGLLAGSLLLSVAAAWLQAGSPAAQASSSDVQAVEAVARDYIEGWYTGDAARMDRALHEDLVKRMPVREGSPEAVRLHPVSKARMVELTAGGGGENPDADFEIVVYDAATDIATARVASPEYLDYLHLAKTDDGWKIVNVLFRVRD